MKKVLVETSARHIHLSEEDLKVLFGEGAQLTIKKESIKVYNGNIE